MRRAKAKRLHYVRAYDEVFGYRRRPFLLTQNDFVELEQFNLAHHGDAREKAIWLLVSTTLSNYEKFWKAFIVLLTNRIDLAAFSTPEWIRVRNGIPRDYEDLAMSNYTTLYYGALAAEQIRENDSLVATGKHYRPELVFFYLECCIENAQRLHRSASTLLGPLCRLPKQPQKDCYETVGRYRNAFAHDPVLGRAIAHSRELVPPPHRLPSGKNSNAFLRWSEVEQIPVSEMIDCIDCYQQLWSRLAVFLQETWESLTKCFTAVRVEEKIVKDLNLASYLPIRCHAGASATNLFAASGTILGSR